MSMRVIKNFITIGVLAFVSGYANASDIVVTIDAANAGFRNTETPEHSRLLITDIRKGINLERTNFGGLSMGHITLQPPAPELIRLVVETKLADVIERSKMTDPPIVYCGIRVFDITTPMPLMYWDINATIELVLRVHKRDRIVLGAATERTYIWPSQEIIERVTTKALQQVSAEVELALAELFGLSQ